MKISLGFWIALIAIACYLFLVACKVIARNPEFNPLQLWLPIVVVLVVVYRIKKKRSK